MRTFAVLLLTFALTGLAGAPASADDKAPPAKKKIDNPEYAHWSAFKVGAFVELTTESTTMGMTSTLKLTHKLTELTAEKAVLETSGTTTAMGHETKIPATKRDVPKQVEIPDITGVKPPNAEVKEGEETIEVAGQKVACKTTETTMDTKTPMGNASIWTKSWSTGEIPGGIAKRESKTTTKAGETTMTMTSKETVTKFGKGG